MAKTPASAEGELRAKKEALRGAVREALAQKKVLKATQVALRRCCNRATCAQQRRKARSQALQVARACLEMCRRQGRSLAGARKRVAAARQRLQEESRLAAETGGELRAARARRRLQEEAVRKALACRDRARTRVKVQALLLRQLRAARSADAHRARRLQALEAKQEAQRRELAAKQRAVAAQLEERLQAQRRSFKRRAAERTREEEQARKRRAKAFAAAAQSGEPMHADKFHRRAATNDEDLSGRLSVLRPRGQRHDYTLVYLHQFCLDGKSYVEWRPHYFFSATKLPHLRLKVTLPTAKAIPITVHDGAEQYAWYDYKTDFDGRQEDELDRQSLRETQSHIFSILDREIALLNGDASRVFLGGASQGCCTALHCALTYPRLLGGFVGIVGHLLSSSPVPASKRNLPIYLYNGREDKTMRWGWVRNTYRRFDDASYTDVHIKVEAGVTHEGPKKKEREWILDFLSNRIPNHGLVKA